MNNNVVLLNPFIIALWGYCSLNSAINGRDCARRRGFNYPSFVFAQNSENGQDKAINKEDGKQNAITNIGLSRSSKIYAIRLKPGQDIKLAIESFAKEQSIKAGFIVTAVGSLQSATLRLADQKDPISLNEKVEIVSLVGTISPDGVHFHLSIADKTGKIIGGHMFDGCKVYTTAEIIVGVLDDVVFSREQDTQTGFKELQINTSKSQPPK